MTCSPPPTFSPLAGLVGIIIVSGILVLGYAYVGLVFLLRALLSRFLDVADALDA